MSDTDSIPPVLVEGFMRLCEGDFSHRLPRNLLRDKDDTAAFFFNAIAEEIDRIMRVSREQEQRLLRSEENFRKLFDAAPVPMVLIDERGTLRMYNDQAADLLEVGRQAVLGASMGEFIADEGEWSMLFERLAKEGVVNARAVRLRTRGGQTPWSLLNARTLRLDDRPTGVLTLADLTEQKRIEERLRRLATRDELTDTLSRGRFFEVVREELARAARYGRPVALAMLDLDHFKSVNDRFGHRAGDDVLRGIAGLMSRRLRGQDQVGRYGGEEFAVLLPETPIDCARDVLDRTRQAIGELKFELGGHAVTITVSVGVVAVM
ncbi:MAG TPA: sensor domain-containing diguanylate cyclase, partial [Polyangiaceae bacterium]|nr:sensor domain-containing diguanylate cyclase [Polyangiaceae bacterium]